MNHKSTTWPIGLIGIILVLLGNSVLPQSNLEEHFVRVSIA
jgi:hypothetical protein